MPNPLLADAPGQVHYLLGNEAIVRGALEAGVSVYFLLSRHPVLRSAGHLLSACL